MRLNDEGINQICEQVKAKWPYLRIGGKKQYISTPPEFTRSFDVSAKETSPRNVTFKSDGTEMYIIGTTSDSVHQYTLSTAWNISTANFTRSFSVSAKETAPRGVTFKSDGTEMYIIGTTSRSVHQYTLGTAWNISTANFTRSFSVAAKETLPYGVTFKSDGTEMYIIGSNSDSVHQYTLSEGWYIGEEYTREIQTTYDGSDFDNALITIPLTSMSVTDNVITIEYVLSVLDLNTETVNMSGLAKELTGTAVESCEYFTGFVKDDLTKYRFTYTISLIR